jgi:hypothetical protein
MVYCLKYRLRSRRHIVDNRDIANIKEAFQWRHKTYFSPDIEFLLIIIPGQTLNWKSAYLLH